MAPALKDARVSEAKFLRALCLFYAVQQWGDIPMPLAEVTAPSKDFPRVASADVYKQIIADLLECEAKLAGYRLKLWPYSPKEPRNFYCRGCI
jgi:hypothetical protein